MDCDNLAPEAKWAYRLPFGYWELVKNRIPDSARPYEDEFNKAINVTFSGVNSRKKNIENLLILKQGLTLDETDLSIYKRMNEWFRCKLEDSTGKNILAIEYREYCRKAILMKQWDHIYYLAQKKSRYIDDLEASLSKPKDDYCSCPEAVRLVVSQWPKWYAYENLYFSYSDDYTYTEQDRLWAKQEVNRIYKKYLGRDLTKEK